MPATRTPREAGMAAKFSGECARCDGAITVGDRIIRRRGSVIHVRCASGQDDE